MMMNMWIVLLLSFHIIKAKGQEMVIHAVGFDSCGDGKSGRLTYTTRDDYQCRWDIKSPREQGKNSIVFYMKTIKMADCTTGFVRFPAKNDSVCDPVCIAYHTPDVTCNTTLIDAEIQNQFGSCINAEKYSEATEMIIDFTSATSARRNFLLEYKTFDCTLSNDPPPAMATTKAATASTPVVTTTSTDAATTSTKAATNSSDAAMTSTKAATTGTKAAAASSDAATTNKENITTAIQEVSMPGSKEPPANPIFTTKSTSVATDKSGTGSNSAQDATKAVMGNESNDDSWWIILLVVIASLSVAGLIIYVIFKRQQKQSGKESNVPVNPENEEKVSDKETVV